jgi:hypothetical protein
MGEREREVFVVDYRNTKRENILLWEKYMWARSVPVYKAV